jgi:SSS family solute:Na+ symporter
MSSSEPFIHSISLSLSKDVLQPALKLSNDVTARLARLLILPVMFLVVAPLAIAEPGSLVMILLVGLGFASQVLPAFVGMFFWPRASRIGVMAGILAGFLVTVAFTTLWPHPLGIHAGFWGLMINLPLFVAVSLITPATDAGVVERFFRIAAPRGLSKMGMRRERVKTLGS